MKLFLGSALVVCSSVFAIIACGKKDDNKNDKALIFNQSNQLSAHIEKTAISCDDSTLKSCQIYLNNSKNNKSIFTAKLLVDDNGNNAISQLKLNDDYQKTLILNLTEEQRKAVDENLADYLIGNITYNHSSADKAASKTDATRIEFNDLTHAQTYIFKLLETVNSLLSEEKVMLNTTNKALFQDQNTLKASKVMPFDSLMKALNDISTNTLLPKYFIDNYKSLGFNFKLNDSKDIVLSYTDKTNGVCQLTFARDIEEKGHYLYKIDSKNAVFKTVDGKTTCSLK